jgi:hypothetical protein
MCMMPLEYIIKEIERIVWELRVHTASLFPAASQTSPNKYCFKLRIINIGQNVFCSYKINDLAFSSCKKKTFYFIRIILNYFGFNL